MTQLVLTHLTRKEVNCPKSEWENTLYSHVKKQGLITNVYVCKLLHGKEIHAPHKIIQTEKWIRWKEQFVLS